MQPDDILKLNASNAQGGSVPLSAFASTRWVTGAMQTVRYNGYPAMRIGGQAAPGYSTGAAMAEVEALAAKLPAGFGYEWTGLSREEKACRFAGTDPLRLRHPGSLPVPAALYESWSIPLAVILVVPLGVLGVVLARCSAVMRTMSTSRSPDHDHRPVGEERHPDHRVREGSQAQGKSAVDAALEAAHLRFGRS